MAEPLFQRSLAIREKTLGPEHLDVALPLKNLAEVLKSQVKTSFGHLYGAFFGQN